MSGKYLFCHFLLRNATLSGFAVIFMFRGELHFPLMAVYYENTFFITRGDEKGIFRSWLFGDKKGIFIVKE